MCIRDSFLPAMVSAWLDLVIVYVLTDIYMSHGMGWSGVIAAFAWSGVVLTVASTVACLVPVLVKWALMGRFRESERPLFSSFVWRNELTDVFAESLAVPSMIRLSAVSYTHLDVYKRQPRSRRISSRSPSHSRSPILYDGACPGQPR